MARREKSFFGKIMGGDALQDDQVQAAEPEEVVEEEMVAEELITEDEDAYIEEEEPQDVAIEYEEETAPVAVAAVPSTAAQKDEDWMSDYEGALNIDMYQTKDNVIIKSTIAGVRPDDIDITVANDMVTIKGTRQREENVNGDDYFYQECYWGSFSRSVIVPVDIDSEEIEADLKDGILTVIIPKAAKAKTKKVKVKGL